MNVVDVEGRKAIMRDCPLCEEAAAESPHCKYSEKPWTMRSCKGCGFVFLEVAPIYEELEEDYAWEKTSVDREAKRRKKHPLLYKLSKSTRWRLHLFKRKKIDDIAGNYVTQGNVIDIGCGKGGQLEALSDSYTPFGIEISKSEASYGKEFAKKRGGRIEVNPALDGLKNFEENFASAIFMRSFLEHEARPKEVLQEVFRVLKKDGVAIIKVPNYACYNRTILGVKWSGFRFPDHLNYFTPQTLRKMCIDCNLSIIRFGLKDRFPLSDNMWLVVGKGECK